MYSFYIPGDVAVFYTDHNFVFGDVMASGIRIRHLLRGDRFEIVQVKRRNEYENNLEKRRCNKLSFKRFFFFLSCILAYSFLYLTLH